MAGKKLALDEWQKERIIRPLFGWKRDDGTRRYRTVYVEIPRKNGKTTLAAGVALFLLFADGEKGAEIVSASGTRDQAAISFDIAKAMVEASPALRKRARIYRRSIVVPATNSTYKVISADASSAHGANLSGWVGDEIHIWPNRELYDALHTGVGARAQPVEFLVTTAGVCDPESIGWQLHSYALQVLNGTVVDDSFLAVIYAADATDAIDDPATWAKANPGLGLSIREPYLAAEAKRAIAEPSYENTFRRLHLDQWTQQFSRWLSIDAWNACAKPMPNLIGRQCYAGLDLSSTQDLTALSLVFPPLTDAEPYYVLPFFWLPEARLKDRRDRVPYDRWAREGILRTTPGNVVDYEAIRRDINELAGLYDIAELRYDPWNSQMLATALSETDGLPLTQLRQGYASLSAPTKQLERLIVSGQLAHGNNPCLNWQIGNVAIRTDPAGNIKIDKSRSTQRIDGVAALVSAISGAMAGNGGASIYATRGLIAL